MASLIERMRLAVHKQSFLNLLRQKGYSMTKVYYHKDVYLKDVSYAPWFILDTFDYVEDKLHVYYYNILPCYSDFRSTCASENC